MLKIRRPLGRLIFNMGIAIPGKTVFLIETAHWYHVRLLVATTHLEMQRPQTVNSGSELHGYLTTWDGTRIVAPVTSWHWCPYSDVIMSAMAYYITSLTIVYSTVYSGADQSPASLAFDRWPVNPPHKGPVTRKCFHLMASSWRHASLDFVIFFTDGLAARCNVS